MDKIRAALQLEDVAEVRRGAHSLRGALANLSAVSAATLAAEMEHSAEIGDLSRADAVFSNLAPELTRVIDALSAICEETVLWKSWLQTTMKYRSSLWKICLSESGMTSWRLLMA
jgi:HPt (histidine-containing phosphotransfer) domain-containing protein